jgi:WXG100 family type VII secretion target
MSLPFDVTPKILHDGAAACRTTNDAVQGQIQQMRNYVDSLMGSYRGTAAMALHSLSEQWHSDAQALNHVLTTIAQGLDHNANNYTHHETVNLANVSKVASSLPAARL